MRLIALAGVLVCTLAALPAQAQPVSRSDARDLEHAMQLLTSGALTNDVAKSFSDLDPRVRILAKRIDACGRRGVALAGDPRLRLEECLRLERQRLQADVKTLTDRFTACVNDLRAGPKRALDAVQGLYRRFEREAVVRASQSKPQPGAPVLDSAILRAELLKDPVVATAFRGGLTALRTSKEFAQMCTEVRALNGTSWRTVSRLCDLPDASPSVEALAVLAGAADSLAASFGACVAATPDDSLRARLAELEKTLAPARSLAPPGPAAAAMTHSVQDLLAHGAVELDALDSILRGGAATLMPPDTAPQAPVLVANIPAALEVLHKGFGTDPLARLKAFAALPLSRATAQTLAQLIQQTPANDVDALVGRIRTAWRDVAIPELLLQGVVVQAPDCTTRTAGLAFRQRGNAAPRRFVAYVVSVPADGPVDRCAERQVPISTGLGVAVDLQAASGPASPDWEQTFRADVGGRLRAAVKDAGVIDAAEWAGFLQWAGLQLPAEFADAPRLLTDGLQIRIAGACVVLGWVQPSQPGCQFVRLDSQLPAVLRSVLVRELESRVSALQSTVVARARAQLALAGVTVDDSTLSNSVSLKGAQLSMDRDTVTLRISGGPGSPFSQLDVVLAAPDRVIDVKPVASLEWLTRGGRAWLTVPASTSIDALTDVAIVAAGRVRGYLRRARYDGKALTASGVGPIEWAGGTVRAALATYVVAERRLTLTGAALALPAPLAEDVDLGSVSVTESNGQLSWSISDERRLPALLERKLATLGLLPDGVGVLTARLDSDGLSVELSGGTAAVRTRLQGLLARLDQSTLQRSVDSAAAQLTNGAAAALRRQLQDQLNDLGQKTGYRIEVSDQLVEAGALRFSLMPPAGGSLPQIRNVRIGTAGLDFSEAAVETGEVCRSVTSALAGNYVSLTNCQVGTATRDGFPISFDLSVRFVAGGAAMQAKSTIRWTPAGLTADTAALTRVVRQQIGLLLGQFPLPQTIDAGSAVVSIDTVRVDAGVTRATFSGKAQVSQLLATPITIEVPFDGSAPQIQAQISAADVALSSLLGAAGLFDTGGLITLVEKPEVRPANSIPTEVVLMIALNLEIIGANQRINLPPLVIDRSGARFERPVSIQIFIGGPYVFPPAVSFDRNFIEIGEKIGLETRISVAALTSIFHVRAQMRLDTKKLTKIDLNGDLILFELFPLGSSRTQIDVEKPEFETDLQFGGALSAIINGRMRTAIKPGGQLPQLIATGSLDVLSVPMGGMEMTFDDRGLNATGTLNLLGSLKAGLFVPRESPSSSVLHATGDFTVGGYRISEAVIRAKPDWATMQFSTLGLRLSLTVPGLDKLNSADVIKLIEDALSPDLNFQEMVNQILKGNLQINPFSSFGGGEGEDGAGSAAGGGNSSGRQGAGAGMYAGDALGAPAAAAGQFARVVTDAARYVASRGAGPAVAIPVAGGSAIGDLDRPGQAAFFLAQEGSDLLLFSQQGQSARQRRQLVWKDVGSPTADLRQHFGKTDVWNSVRPALSSNAGFFSQALDVARDVRSRCSAPDRDVAIWWYVERAGQALRYAWNPSPFGICLSRIDQWRAKSTGALFNALTAFHRQLGVDLAAGDVDMTKIAVRETTGVAAIWYPRPGERATYSVFLGESPARQIRVRGLEAIQASGSQLRFDAVIKWASASGPSAMTVLQDSAGAVLALATFDTGASPVLLYERAGTLSVLRTTTAPSARVTALFEGANAAAVAAAVRGPMLDAIRSAADPVLSFVGDVGLVVQTESGRQWAAIGEGCIATGRVVDRAVLRARVTKEQPPAAATNRLGGSCPNGADDRCVDAILQGLVQSPNAATRRGDLIKLAPFCRP